MRLTPIPYAIVQIDATQDADLFDGFRLVGFDPAGAYQMVTDEGLAACSPRDITGSVLEAVLAPSYEFSTPIDRFTGSDIVIDDPTQGHAYFNLPQSRTTTWPVGEWRFIMREITADGRHLDTMRGPFIVHPRRF